MDIKVNFISEELATVSCDDGLSSMKTTPLDKYEALIVAENLMTAASELLDRFDNKEVAGMVDKLCYFIDGGKYERY